MKRSISLLVSLVAFFILIGTSGASTDSALIADGHAKEHVGAKSDSHGSIVPGAIAHQGESSHGESHGGHHGPAPINWTDFGYKQNGKAPPLIAALVNFAIFIMLLFFHIPGTKVGLGLAKKLSDSYANKHVTIKDGLEEGAKLRKEAELKLQEYGQKIKDVDKEVEGVLGNIKKDAELEKARIVEEANKQAARAKAETEKRIESDLNLAKKGLEKEVLVAATIKAEEKIRSGQTPQDQTRLFEQFMGQLDQEIANKKNQNSDELLRRI